MAFLVEESPPCVLFEDEHLLVVNKPAGWNTHAPSPYAGEGIYDWLRHREPRWANLAIVQRLDKETSGVLLFTKTTRANQSLTRQFAERAVRKVYQLLTDREPSATEFSVRSHLVRAGNKYLSRSGAGGVLAQTQFRLLPAGTRTGRTWRIEARPLTGRTHQIRVHAAERGIPILGDILYGGTPAGRVFLHAYQLTVRHPESNAEMTFTAEPEFETDSRVLLRERLGDPRSTNCYRLVHGAADGVPGEYLDRLGDYFLSAGQSSEAPGGEAGRVLAAFSTRYSPLAIYRRLLRRQPGRAAAAESSPHLLDGRALEKELEVRENGVRFCLSFQEGYSVGLFLDQRDNRRRLLRNHIAAGFPVFVKAAAEVTVLNVFAYTCAFSVCAAKCGCKTTSLDLSRSYLEWGRRNFELNGIPLAPHDFIYGDAFQWMQRLARKGRLFDVLILDPPTFSRSKQHGTFQAEKNYGKLMAQALPLLAPGGVLFASTNAATFAPESFLEEICSSAAAAGRRITRQHYAPQPPDFPMTREEPGYLKTVWSQLE